MSLSVRNLKCLSPVMCQCKVICSNRTLSLMFGCKVRLCPGCVQPTLAAAAAEDLVARVEHSACANRDRLIKCEVALVPVVAHSCVSVLQ